jgi:integrase
VASIKKRPNDKWRARYRDPDGREHARHFDRKIDAQNWLNEVTTDLVTGRYVDPNAGRVTFEEYAERWLRSQPHRPSTASLYARLLRLHVYPTLGHRALSSIKRSDVQGWVAAFGQTHAPETVRGTYARVRTIFLAAVEDRVLAESPCRRIALPERDDAKVVPLTIPQVRALVDAAPEDLRALVMLAAATGLRSGELLGLEVDRLDFLRRQVKVDQQLVYVTGSEPYMGPPKTKASRRTVPVPSFALDEVAAHLQRQGTTGGLVFRSTSGGPILRTTLNGRWRRIVKRAELPETTKLHHLRHHYASVLIDGGESVKVVQERLGHASAVETLKTYSHLFPSSDERTRSVVEAAWTPAPADSVRTGGA